MLDFFKSQLRTQMEYLWYIWGVIAWSSLSSLERVQKRLWSFINFIPTTFSYRRNGKKLLQVLQILNLTANTRHAEESKTFFPKSSMCKKFHSKILLPPKSTLWKWLVKPFARDFDEVYVRGLFDYNISIQI